MKIKVRINTAECFRHGINLEEETTELDLDPGMFNDEERNYIADQMIDGWFGPYNNRTDPEIIKPWIAERFEICPPSVEGFIEAVRRGIDAKEPSDNIPF